MPTEIYRIVVANLTPITAELDDLNILRGAVGTYIETRNLSVTFEV